MLEAQRRRQPRGVAPVLLPALLFIGAGCGGSEAGWDRGAARAPAVQLGFPRACERAGRIYLVPLGNLGRVDLHEVVQRYRDEYGLGMEVLDVVALGPEATDSSRRQLVAESLAAAIGRAQPRLSASPDAILIGVTDEDLHVRAYSWDYALAARFERLGVVSTARLSARGERATVDAAIFARLYKLITRALGELYCRFPASDNPRSVMHGGAHTVEALDLVDESVW